MYRIIVSDLDETLLHSDRSISQKNIEAIQVASRFGIKFIPATGRNFISVQPTLKTLGFLDKEDEYVISFNGAVITENKNNRIIYSQPLPFELAESFFERGKNYNVGMHIYTKDKVYVYRLTDDEQAYQTGRMELTEFFDDDLHSLKGQDILKILYINTDRDYLQKIEKDLQDLTRNVDVSYSSNRYLEFNAKGVNKGDALRLLAEKLGVDIKDTIAIGDNFNDLSMIKVAGLGVGVQNTNPDMKNECDVITKATCDEDAIAEVIESYILKSNN